MFKFKIIVNIKLLLIFRFLKPRQLKMTNDVDDEIEVEDTKSKVWGAQEVNKASSKV